MQTQCWPNFPKPPIYPINENYFLLFSWILNAIEWFKKNMNFPVVKQDRHKFKHVSKSLRLLYFFQPTNGCLKYSNKSLVTAGIVHVTTDCQFHTITEWLTWVRSCANLHQPYTWTREHWQPWSRPTVSLTRPVYPANFAMFTCFFSPHVFIKWHS